MQTFSPIILFLRFPSLPFSISPPPPLQTPPTSSFFFVFISKQLPPSKLFSLMFHQRWFNERQQNPFALASTTCQFGEPSECLETNNNKKVREKETTAVLFFSSSSSSFLLFLCPSAIHRSRPFSGAPLLYFLSWRQNIAAGNFSPPFCFVFFEVFFIFYFTFFILSFLLLSFRLDFHLWWSNLNEWWAVHNALAKPSRQEVKLVLIISVFCGGKSKKVAVTQRSFQSSHRVIAVVRNLVFPTWKCLF